MAESNKADKNKIEVKAIDEVPSDRSSGAENLEKAISGGLVEEDPNGEKQGEVISSVDYPTSLKYRGKEVSVSPRARLHFNDAAQVEKPLQKGLTLIEK